MSATPTPEFALHHAGRVIPLTSGTYVLGRSMTAQIALEDGLVSRRHAQLLVQPGRVVLEDLGSVNGVFVNGERVSGSVSLRVGDRVVIGKQELVLNLRGPDSEPPPTDARLAAVTLVGMEDDGGLAHDSESTHQGDALELLGGVADKVLVLGRGAEAEKILGAYLKNLMDRTRANRPLSPDRAERAAAYAVKLATATGKGEWVDYAVELYSLLKRPLPASLVDELFTVLRQVSGINLAQLRGYVALLRVMSPGFGPADRFLAQRIEGLERQASAR